MSEWQLRPFSLPAPGPIRSLVVQLQREGQDLLISYQLAGQIGQLDLPAPAATASRRDELWRHSCFELFAARDSAYREYNFAPDGSWAAYDFTARRTGMSAASVPAPHLTSARTASTFELNARVPLTSSPQRLGLCAVLQDWQGQISYWALAHLSDRPDFHDPASFLAEVSA